MSPAVTAPGLPDLTCVTDWPVAPPGEPARPVAHGPESHGLTTRAPLRTPWTRTMTETRMFCCYHDPGLALFLSETGSDDANPDPLEWVALAATNLLACVTFAVLP